MTSNSSLEIPIFLPSAIEHLSALTNLFEVPDIERKIKYQDNPHHWLERDICQIQNFTYHFLKQITLNAQTVSQIRVYSLFLRKFFVSIINFYGQNVIRLHSMHSQISLQKKNVFLFLIKEQNRHKFYVNPTHIPNILIDLLQFDPMCINENPNENDNRPFQYTRTTTDINIVLDQQEAENTNSLISTQTTQQTSIQIQIDKTKIQIHLMLIQEL